MAFTQISVVGTYQNPDGTAATGGVRFSPVVTMRNSVSGGEINARTKIHGQVVAGVLGPVSLAATTDTGTTPTGVMYLVEEFIVGAPVRRYHLAVPHDGGTLDLDTATIVETQPGAIYIPSPGPAGATGATGATGAAGRTVLSGTSAPGGGVGVDGDFYIDTTADTIYGPKTVGAWGSATSLIGPAGPPGAGSVDTVNGDPGPNIVLDAADVGAATAGRALALTMIVGA